MGEVLVLCTSSLLSSQALDPAHRRPVLSLICVSQCPNITTRKSQGPAVVLSGRPSAVALGAGPVLHLGPRKARMPSLVTLPHLLFLQIALRGLAKAWTSVLCASCTPGSLCAIGMQGPFFFSLDATRMGKRVGKHHQLELVFLGETLKKLGPPHFLQPVWPHTLVPRVPVGPPSSMEAALGLPASCHLQPKICHWMEPVALGPSVSSLKKCGRHCLPSTKVRLMGSKCKPSLGHSKPSHFPRRASVSAGSRETRAPLSIACVGGR